MSSIQCRASPRIQLAPPPAYVAVSPVVASAIRDVVGERFRELSFRSIEYANPRQNQPSSESVAKDPRFGKFVRALVGEDGEAALSQPIFARAYFTGRACFREEALLVDDGGCLARCETSGVLDKMLALAVRDAYGENKAVRKEIEAILLDHNVAPFDACSDQGCTPGSLVFRLRRERLE